MSEPDEAERPKWDTPTCWGVTDSRVRVLFNLYKTDEDRIEAMISLIAEAGKCSRITALQLARRLISSAGADSQWTEIIEKEILREKMS